MSSRYRFALASPEDDAQLRARMAADNMEGDIVISFRREPSYFAGCRVQGDRTEVIKCVDTTSGEIVGLGSRSSLIAYLNGEPQRIGYLADLRSEPSHRRGTLLARGYRFLRELHERDPLPFYTTVIFAGNRAALDSLVGARARLPIYRDFGRILTPAIHLDFPRRSMRLPGVELVRGSASDLSEIVQFLNKWQGRRQFAPCHSETEFGSGRFTGLGAENFFLARRHRRIVATLGVWNQAAIRQTHVESYSPALSRLRPLYNLAARLSPLKPLPAAGARIPYVYLACLAAEEDDARLLAVVLRDAYNQLRRGPWHYAIAGLHETDPLALVLNDYRTIPAAGRLFVVHYPEDAERVTALEGRIPYLEAGCL
jgi:hypothetical protein